MTSISTSCSNRLTWKIAFENLKFAMLKWYFWGSLGVVGSKVIFDPLKGLKAPIIQKTIKIYLKDYSREVSTKNRIYSLRGFQSLCLGHLYWFIIRRIMYRIKVFVCIIIELDEKTWGAFPLPPELCQWRHLKFDIEHVCHVALIIFLRGISQ